MFYHFHYAYSFFIIFNFCISLPHVQLLTWSHRRISGTQIETSQPINLFQEISIFSDKQFTYFTSSFIYFYIIFFSLYLLPFMHCIDLLLLFVLFMCFESSSSPHKCRFLEKSILITIIITIISIII